jgi:trimeric autotransporter adhesin
MELGCVNRFKSGFSTNGVRSKRRSPKGSQVHGIEVLECRELLSTFTVTNLHNSGAGSLRQAIVESNQQPGANSIDFDVAGTIRIVRTSLPAITNTVTINGSTAPSFAGSPVVTVNFQGTNGLRFGAGSDGSTVESLSLVKAGNAGITITASNVTVQGNDIGLLSNGKTIAGNRGDGIQINASSHADLIGQSNPVSSIDSSGIISYQGTVNVAFQLSNVISGNGGNGIGIYGADDNTIAMNNIGTDATGTLRRGNAKNGILVTSAAVGNVIGGQATGGNDPTAGVYVRPPQGNLISANRGNGVLITNGATQTLLSGNFVGTDASGDSPLGNQQDGVAIVKANGNQLIGCTFQQSPFVFYNVLSGNGANGLRITNSNNTTVQANFMGAGADNSTIVANHGDGLLVSGSSKNTQVGGPIPLGNVISGNNKNGIEVNGKASGLTSFNTFAGTFAFGAAAPNRGDGILVTSTGGNNLIRTCIVSGNLKNGIELAGNATGVQVTDTTVGLEVTNSGTLNIPNVGSGIKIDGRAHNNAIGGFQPSIEPQVTISNNDGYGIAIVGSARDNVVYNSYIGTDYLGLGDLGNQLGGIYVGAGTSSITIGGTSSSFQNKIFNSGGAGVTIQASSGDTVVGNQISSNVGNGVTIIQAKRLTVGGSVSGDSNTIVTNQGYGVSASGVCTGSVVQSNAIAANGLGNVNLTKSRGMTYIP